ncbi:MAG: methyl-accepting chemotaxis protein, partial [Clostridia bacterium]
QLVNDGKSREALDKLGEGKKAMDAFYKVNQMILKDVDNIVDKAWTETQAASDQTKLTIVVGASSALLAAILSAILLIKGIVRPARRIGRQLMEFAEGEGDLTRTIAVTSNDELGDLAHAFNRMSASLRELIRQVGTSAEVVKASAAELTASIEHNGKASEQIAQSIQEVAADAGKQVVYIKGNSASLDAMSQGLSSIAKGSGDVSGFANQTAQIAQAGTQRIELAIRQMDSINKTVEGLADHIYELGKDSKEIEKIVEAITTIAAQTNLLALNAAIEAARAGEHGRGFAVVAGEVRKLAEQSGESSRQIIELIVNVQAQIHHAVKAMKQSAQEVQEGITFVNQVGESFVDIKDAVDEVARQIIAVSDTSREVASGAEAVASSFAQMIAVTEHSASGTQAASAASEEQLASVEEITASADSLARMSEELQLLIGKFKV